MVEVRIAAAEYTAQLADCSMHNPKIKDCLAGRMDDTITVQAFASIYQRGKLEGARLAIEAAAKDAEEWFPADTSKRYPSFGVIASICALSPAKIVGEG